MAYHEPNASVISRIRNAFRRPERQGSANSVQRRMTNYGQRAHRDSSSSQQNIDRIRITRNEAKAILSRLIRSGYITEASETLIVSGIAAGLPGW